MAAMIWLPRPSIFLPVRRLFQKGNLCVRVAGIPGGLRRPRSFITLAGQVLTVNCEHCVWLNLAICQRESEFTRPAARPAPRARSTHLEELTVDRRRRRASATTRLGTWHRALTTQVRWSKCA